MSTPANHLTEARARLLLTLFLLAFGLAFCALVARNIAAVWGPVVREIRRPCNCTDVRRARPALLFTRRLHPPRLQRAQHDGVVVGQPQFPGAGQQLVERGDHIVGLQEVRY